MALESRMQISEYYCTSVFRMSRRTPPQSIDWISGTVWFGNFARVPNRESGCTRIVVIDPGELASDAVQAGRFWQNHLCFCSPRCHIGMVFDAFGDESCELQNELVSFTRNCRRDLPKGRVPPKTDGRAVGSHSAFGAV